MNRLSNEQNDEEQAKRARVERIKLMQLKEEQKAKPKDDWDRKMELENIALFRERAKKDLINKLNLESEILNRQSVNAVPGEPQFVEVEVHNPYERAATFNVEIDDPDESLLKKSELFLVDNKNKEWEFWYNKGKCTAVKDWDITNASKMKVSLDANETSKLLFKF